MQQLSVVGLAARRAALEQAMQQMGLAFSTQQQIRTEKTPRPVCNYLLLPQNPQPFILFCAHYDSAPESPGSNDNAAAVCILLQLAKTCQLQNIQAGFAFLDAEENGHAGAKYFEANRPPAPILAVVNLDICGYGDTLAVHCKGSKNHKNIRNFCSRQLLQTHGGRLVKFLPESDDKCFKTRNQPVLSVAIMPAGDVPFLNALALYKDNFLGKPPEYTTMLEQMEVYTTMHGGFRDGPEWVQPEAMQQVYNYLLAALTAPPPAGKFFWKK